MAILYDYECNRCGTVFEVITDPDDTRLRVCDKCGLGLARRIISASGQYTGNQDAAWLKSVVDIVDKGPTATAADREFAKNPTRENHRKWMKSRGLIPYEPGMPTKPAPKDESRLMRAMMEAHRKRRRIEIG